MKKVYPTQMTEKQLRKHIAQTHNRVVSKKVIDTLDKLKEFHDVAHEYDKDHIHSNAKAQ